ncbi:MAG: transcription elongation factor GreA [Parcubacteria group bacterium Gr01-1014_44]|nr:MAG: transcription elongation factor GreA [Parcubacteria group bacterium Gr01-1014_44]
MNQGQYFSPEGLEKLKKELEERKYVLRKEIATKIVEAKDLGDLAENAEFTEAKEMQAFNEGRIEELDSILKHAQLIFKPSGGIVEVGSTVKAKSPMGEHTFTIVGASESNPVQGFISNESPLGQAFIGQIKGNEIEVRTPKGFVKYKILEVL